MATGGELQGAGVLEALPQHGFGVLRLLVRARLCGIGTPCRKIGRVVAETGTVGDQLTKRISSPPLPFGSGLPSESLLARSSNPTSPRAISFASSAAVKVLVSEAISNCVRGVTLTPFSTSA